MNENDSLTATMLTEDVLAAGKTMLSQLDAQLEHLGLSAAKLWALQAIAQSTEKATVTYLATCMGTAKSNVTAMIDRLETDHLVTRTRDLDDRRSVQVVFTAKGQELYEKGMEVFYVVNGKLCEVFTPKELSVFQHMLRRVINTNLES